MVGNEMLRVLSQRAFPSERVVALASERSKGMTVPYNGSSLKVEELSESAFKGIDVAPFAAGRSLVDELEEQTKAIAEGEEPAVVVYPYQLAYNVVPGGWHPEPDGYNEEEVKIVNETRKILHQPELRITATCVRVPVPVGHGESVFLETTEKLSAAEARGLLAASPGVVGQDDPHARLY